MFIFNFTPHSASVCNTLGDPLFTIKRDDYIPTARKLLNYVHVQGIDYPLYFTQDDHTLVLLYARPAAFRLYTIEDNRLFPFLTVTEEWLLDLVDHLLLAAV